MNQKIIAKGMVEIVAVGDVSLRKAENRVVACQGCSPSVSRTFSSVLVEVLGASSRHAEYIVVEAARCSACASPITENTLVRCEGEIDEEARWAASTPDLTSALSLDNQNLVLVGEALVREAEASISGCAQCSHGAELTFDYILDEVTNCDPTLTEYVICRPAKCPRCHGDVTEKTLVTMA